MKFNINFNVIYRNQNIDDIMCAALEGGINYWCENVEVEGEYLGEFASEQISRGGTLIFHDSEKAYRYELTLDKFLKGLEVFIRERGLDAIYDLDIETIDIDAEDADAIIQYALFGDIIYG